ncbi:hypothetical protein ACH5RR_015113 [Cinchona calisaya]|uniref:Uncharacterized protein n=1 Tax=Cinchona calisaya TaxID=153742 RepID=A0ABD2ZS68_9GENT
MKVSLEELIQRAVGEWIEYVDFNESSLRESKNEPDDHRGQKPNALRGRADIEDALAIRQSLSTAISKGWMAAKIQSDFKSIVDKLQLGVTGIICRYCPGRRFGIVLKVRLFLLVFVFICLPYDVRMLYMYRVLSMVLVLDLWTKLTMDKFDTVNINMGVLALPTLKLRIVSKWVSKAERSDVERETAGHVADSIPVPTIQHCVVVENAIPAINKKVLTVVSEVGETSQ